MSQLQRFRPGHFHDLWILDARALTTSDLSRLCEKLVNDFGRPAFLLNGGQAVACQITTEPAPFWIDHPEKEAMLRKNADVGRAIYCDFGDVFNLTIFVPDDRFLASYFMRRSDWKASRHSRLDAEFIQDWQRMQVDVTFHGTIPKGANPRVEQVAERWLQEASTVGFGGQMLLPETPTTRWRETTFSMSVASPAPFTYPAVELYLKMRAEFSKGRTFENICFRNRTSDDEVRSE